MNDFTTKFTETLLNNAPLEEFFRKELETALNSLLKTESDAFPGYEKYAQEGYNGGDSRNGSYCRTLQTKYGTLQLEIPRDRFGEFKQRTIPPYTHSDKEFFTMNNNYYRITAYHPEKNISVIADSNGKFEKLWQFSSYFVCKGFEIISVSRDEQFTCGTIPKVNTDTAHILIRACCKGKPIINGSYIEMQGKMYQPQSE